MAGRDRFPTTRISLVLAAGANPTAQSTEALATLCRLYWYPLYVYVRRRGYNAGDAEDITQGFFARVLEKRSLGTFQQERGRFRSFLLGALHHFLADERDWANRLKRGGGETMVSLETRYSQDPLDDRTPETAFDRRWALTVLDRVFDRLREEFERTGKGRQFERFKGLLTGEGADESYSAAADALGMTEGAVKVAIHRLRSRFRETLCEEIADTVADPEEVGDEIRYLMAALRGAV